MVSNGFDLGDTGEEALYTLAQGTMRYLVRKPVANQASSLMPKIGGSGTPRQTPQVHIQHSESSFLASWFSHSRKP